MQYQPFYRSRGKLYTRTHFRARARNRMKIPPISARPIPAKYERRNAKTVTTPFGNPTERTKKQQRVWPLSSHHLNSRQAMFIKYVRRRSVKGKRPAVKDVKPIVPHKNLVACRQSRYIIGRLPSVKGWKCLLLDIFHVNTW